MMNNENLNGTATAGVVSVSESSGCQPAVALEMWAEAVIDRNRFNRVDRALQMCEDEQVSGRFASCQQLVELGADLVQVATAFENGLTPRAFRKALKKGLNLTAFSKAVGEGLDPVAFSTAVMTGLDLDMFSQALGYGLRVSGFAEMVETLDIRTLNGSLANFCDSAEDVRSFPHPVERALVLSGHAD